MKLQDGWQKFKLGQVADIDRKSVTPARIESNTTYIGLEHITESGAFINVNKVQTGELASNKFHFNPEHVLYGKLRPYLKKIARPTFSGICSTDILPILPRSNLDRGFLFHFLRQQSLIDYATSRCAGVNLPRLSPTHLADFDIPLPPLPEQKRIAAILDKADAIRRKRQESIRLTEEFLRSTFLDMFGDPVTNPKGWQRLKLQDAFPRDRAGTCCGPFGSALKKHEYRPSGIPVWGIDNVNVNQFVEENCLFIEKEKYDELNRYRVEHGDILISRAGTVGRMCVARPSCNPSIIGSNLIRLTLDGDQILPEYFVSLYSYFSTRLPGLKASGDEKAYSFMNTGSLKGLEIPVPPVAKQERFVACLNKRRRDHKQIVSALSESENLFNSL
ncbi:MAG: restriction endonuclease subunit S, partial [Planctomycetota bacterium]|nr:restriction endonuclease subunit S [Planctomycetota bacterium]